ncbi:MAG: hydrogenase maturation nickel metallochaperone HypA [Magnetococcales bacterium]|nr:hydrogenase maturation nickel metallochaperone HypA [Magnetococcales bacterium]
MHELSVCQALLQQVARLAAENRATAVTRLRVRNGPLSGVDSQLLQRAYAVARCGTVAETALLELETEEVGIHCPRCDREYAVAPNALVCPACGEWRTRVVAGEALILLSVELETDFPQEAPDGSTPPPDT